MKPIIIYTKDETKIKQLIKFCKETGIDYHQIIEFETGLVETMLSVLKFNHDCRRKPREKSIRDF
jgi:MinD superfamily P-loop ATPase